MSDTLTELIAAATDVARRAGPDREPRLREAIAAFEARPFVLDIEWLRRLEALLVNAHRSLPDNLIVDEAILMVNAAFVAIANASEGEGDPDDMEHDFSNAVRGAVIPKPSEAAEPPSLAMQYLEKLVADQMAPLYAAFAASPKASDPVEPPSLAMQYVEKLVADQMAPIYAAFGVAPKAGKPVDAATVANRLRIGLANGTLSIQAPGPATPMDGEARKDFIRGLNAELWKMGLGGMEPTQPDLDPIECGRGRVITPERVDDAMVLRGCNAYSSGGKDFVEAMRAALSAALTPLGVAVNEAMVLRAVNAYSDGGKDFVTSMRAALIAALTPSKGDVS